MRTLGLAAILLGGWILPGFAAGFDDLNQGIAARNARAWDSAIAFFDKALAAAGQVLTAGQREKLDASVADLRAKMPTEDPDAIYEAMTAANTAADPLTQAQMDAVLKKTAVGKKLDEF